MSIDVDEAIKKLGQIFTLSSSDKSHLSGQSPGKVYELYCLAQVLLELKQRGCGIKSPRSGLIGFKASPGPINSSYPSFEIFPPKGGL